MINNTKILEKIIEEGYQITPEAFRLLENTEDPAQTTEKLIKAISEKKDLPLVLDKDLINSIIKANREVANLKPEFEVNETVKGALRSYSVAREITPEIKLVFDPTGKSYSTGKTEEFVKYFQSRYSKIKKIFISRNDMRDVLNISDIHKRASLNEKIKLIAIVMDKKETAKGNLFLDLEDPTGTTKAVVNKNNQELFKKANRIILDQVLCFEGIVSQSELFFVDEIHWPDTSTQHKTKNLKDHVLVALLSDTHIGSKHFLEKYFIKFINWINGKAGNEKQREIASRVKYIIFAGDLVDGIGVYPRQEEDLQIVDIYEQYDKAQSLLERIPEYVSIIISPGNHDASRQALPQPAIPEKYAKGLYKLSNIMMVGNPCQIEIHGQNFLIYHGRSLDDIAATIQGADILKPTSLMKELLVSRHLAPEFGNRSPISPEFEDYLVIENEPDVFHAGHIHVNGVELYRNITIVNSGTWQKQTNYQRSMGVVPTPCKVPLYDLSTNKISIIDFMEYNGV